MKQPTQNAQGSLARSGSNQSPAAEPSLPAGLTAAHFTVRELETIRAICRDADNELGVRMLRDALARAGAK